MNSESRMLGGTCEALRVLLLSVMALGLSGCGVLDLGGGRSSLSDNIERDIKARLLLSEDVDAAPLRISLQGSAIVLEGFVDSEEESARVEAVVRKLYPANQVANNLEAR